MRTLTLTLLIGVCLAGISSPLSAQCKTGGEEPVVAASPSQPVVTDSPDTIGTGVGELEYGWQRAWLGAGADASGSGTMFKMGVFCNFEFRTYFTAWQSSSVAAGPAVEGIGDTWLTGQYRFHRQSRELPALAVHYTFKQPTADSQLGLGSGQRDQIVAISAGKDFRQTSFNFETKYIRLGQPGGEAASRYQEYSFNATRALMRNFSLTGEIYSDTRHSAGGPGLVSTLWSIGYSPNARLVFDTGIDVGLTHGAPDKRFFAGVSYALGDLYKPLRHHRPPSD
jgi:hypothetical protein